MRVLHILTIAILATLLVTGCKSKREKLGDAHLEKQSYKIAVQMYLNAEEKGDVSEEFPANVSLALTGYMEEIAKRDPLSAAVSNYTEEIPKYLAKVTDPTVIGKYGTTIANITKMRIKEGEFVPILQGFKAIDVAIDLLAKMNATNPEFETIVDETTKFYVQSVIETTKSESDYVRAEYFLLEAKTALPKNEEIQSELNKVRLKNRSNFLIFAQDVNGITPSPLVDQNAFVIAFPSLKSGKTKTSGELQMWNTSGNNASFKAKDILLVSTTGDEVSGKRVKGGCDKLDNEGDCAMWITWKYKKGFVPEYVLAKNGNAEGRKYLGVK